MAGIRLPFAMVSITGDIITLQLRCFIEPGLFLSLVACPLEGDLVLSAGLTRDHSLPIKIIGVLLRFPRK